MARTGISIKVSNSVFGAPQSVNSNSIMFVVGATAVTTGSIAFTLGVAYMLRSTDDLTALGITEENNKDVYRQVVDFYAPLPNIDNTGIILWLVGIKAPFVPLVNIMTAVQSTVINGQQFRPRNMIFSQGENATAPQEDIQKAVTELYTAGFSTVAIMDSFVPGAITAAVSDSTMLRDLSTLKSGMVGTVIVTNRQGDRACVGAIGGWMAQLSVGTSIGDTSLQAFSNSLFFYDGTKTTDSVTWINTPCSSISNLTCNLLGDKQYIFARTRPPRNGLWLNDGATAEDPATALSTLEAARTIASMVDDLRSFFVPYINSRVPVDTDGAIQSTYKQVILDNARASVITPYIESGDISDARISLKATGDDFLGTRSWEVTLEILPAFTLRWVNGYVFYVKNLN